MSRATRGVSYTKHFDDTLKSAIYETQVPNVNFLYEVSTTQNPEFSVGDSVILGDRREMIYCKSLGDNALFTAEACAFTDTGQIAYVTATAVDAGASELTVPAQTHAAAFEIDELRGGYLIVFQSTKTQFKGIVGNDYSAVNAAVKIYLDSDLTTAVTSSHAYEVYGNPYSYMDQKTGYGTNIGYGGPPMEYVSAAENYFWMQINGARFIAPSSNMNGKNAAGFCWKGDGSADSVKTSYTATIPDDNTSQYAGFRLAGSQSGNGPIVMLQG